MTDIHRIQANGQPEKCRIVHLGLGAFHRAHQAMYLQQCLNNGDMAWGIISANLRSNHSLVTRLRQHEHRYHIAEYRDSENLVLREITVISEVLYAGQNAGDDGVPDDREKLLEFIAAPSTRIVTLTVTEKGYGLIPSTGELDTANGAIQADLLNPQYPLSAPGVLAEGLRRRCANDAGDLTVLSCDNMPENGHRTRNAVLGMARQVAEMEQTKGLPTWIAEHVSFPNSMVDRIVPATTDADRERLAKLGVNDRDAVVCEAFAQWAIENNFAAGRPDWEEVGVEMVTDVRPFETMKLRMLNGSHSLLAYLGSLAGMETVAEAVSHEDITKLLRHYMQDEAAPTLAMPEGVDLADYRERLMARFGNDSLAHYLQQIATDGSQKIAQRWLAGARIQLNKDGPIDCVALGVAGWIRYQGAQDLQGRSYTVHDPMMGTLTARFAEHASDARRLIDAFLADETIFDPELAASRRFADAVYRHYRQLTENGLATAVKTLFA